MTETTNTECRSPEKPISDDIHDAIDDSLILVSYIAKDGNKLLDESLTRQIINAKYARENHTWSEKQEHDFLVAYDKLAKAVFPVTVDSIQAIQEPPRSKRGRWFNWSVAKGSVTLYRFYTAMVLALLLALQMFALQGNNLKTNLLSIQKQHADTLSLLQREQVSNDNREFKRLLSVLENQDNQLNANYQMLHGWNRIWSFQWHEPELKITLFRAAHTYRELLKEGASLKTISDSTYTEHLTNFYKDIYEASFMLDALQGYILPLLYGMLGALIFVLRSLMREIRELTYTREDNIRYNLRVTLGALGGMIIGWFLKPDQTEALTSLSPMALAFLVGYNIDVLFAAMDKAIETVSKSINAMTPSDTDQPHQPATPQNGSNASTQSQATNTPSEDKTTKSTAGAQSTRDDSLKSS